MEVNLSVSSSTSSLIQRPYLVERRVQWSVYLDQPKEAEICAILIIIRCSQDLRPRRLVTSFIQRLRIRHDEKTDAGGTRNWIRRN